MSRKSLIVVALILNIIVLIYVKIDDSCALTGFQSKWCDQRLASPLLRKFDQFERLRSDDLSNNLVSIDDFKDKTYEWDICESVKKTKSLSSDAITDGKVVVRKPVKYCPFSALIEQTYQLQFFKTSLASCRPKVSDCVLLPPKNYQWLSKHVKFPTAPADPAVPWPNLGVESWSDLIDFNPRHPKNMMHFNASFYDIQQEEHVNLAARYIPFGKKIRTMLELGAGGGSISFILNKRYDVTVLNTAFADFPYCEYITERGGLCLLLNAMAVMPFAKFSFDVIHHSWVYHSLTPTRWRDVILEQNRILRPGGYLWISDGLSNAQLKTIKFLLLQQLGYKILYEKITPRQSINVIFGSMPYELDWYVIMVKPNKLKNDLHQCK